MASWTTIGTIAMRAGAVALLTLLLILGGEALKRRLIAIAGPRAQRKITHDVIKAIDRQIERYLVARLMISAIVAGSTWIGLWVLGVHQALMLGVVAGVINVMPFIGPGVAVGPDRACRVHPVPHVGGAMEAGGLGDADRGARRKRASRRG